MKFVDILKYFEPHYEIYTETDGVMAPTIVCKSKTDNSVYKYQFSMTDIQDHDIKPSRSIDNMFAELRGEIRDKKIDQLFKV